MEPLVVLFVLPVLIGAASVALLRDTIRASCAAALGAPVIVFCCLRALDPDGTWNWLAALLVAPLAMAFALAAVMLCAGGSPLHKRHPRNGR